MTLSFLLTIYFIFLIIYSAVLGFAVYKVFMFAKNKDLKGYSRRMTLTFLATMLSIVFITLLVIRSYNWNDNFSFYCKKIFPDSCLCEASEEEQKICQEEKKLEANKKDQGAGKNINQLPKP